MLPLETVLALVSFAFVSSITPGPNNLMLATSGVNYGFRQSIPHMLGICAGFSVLLLAVGFGLGGVVLALPQLRMVLKLVGAAYLLWLAWKIASSRPPAEVSDDAAREAARGKPMSFLGACAFQWVNVKAWVMALGAMTIYVREGHVVGDVLTVSAVFALVNLPCVSSWAAFGHALGSSLSNPVRLRAFNVVMALLLVASIVPMVMD